MVLIGQAEAAGVGKVRHKRLVNLIGCCAEGDERLLVAEYNFWHKLCCHKCLDVKISPVMIANQV